MIIDINNEYKKANIILFLLLLCFIVSPYLFINLIEYPIDLSYINCFVKNETGVPCKSCGLTRSVLSLYRGDIFQSQQYSPKGIIFVIMGVVQLFLRIIPLLIKSILIPWIDIAQIIISSVIVIIII